MMIAALSASDVSAYELIRHINDLLPGLRFTPTGVSFPGTRMLEEPRVLWFVFFPLPFDVALDLGFVQSDGRRKISNAPDAVFFKIDFTDEFELFSQIQTACGLELADGICHCDVRRYLHLYVDMVFIGIHTLDPERRILFAGLVQAFLERRFHILFQYFSSPSRSPHNMVLVLIGGVVETGDPHGTSVPRSTVVRIRFHSSPPSSGYMLYNDAAFGRGFLVIK